MYIKKKKKMKQHFPDEVQKVKTDISLTGTTVAELLQTGPRSLATVLNDREVRQEEA